MWINATEVSGDLGNMKRLICIRGFPQAGRLRSHVFAGKMPALPGTPEGLLNGFNEYRILELMLWRLRQ